MDAKEKAAELVNKFYDELNKINGIYIGITKQSKQCALIAVYEIIKVLDEISIAESGRVHIDYGQSEWQKVKEEIIKL